MPKTEVSPGAAGAAIMNRLPYAHPSEIADDVSRPKQENTRPSPKQLACEVLQGRASVVEDEIFLDGKPATLADLVRAAAQRGVAIHYPGIFPIPEAYRTGPSLLGAMRRSGAGRLGRRLGAGGRRSQGPSMPSTVPSSGGPRFASRGPQPSTRVTLWKRRSCSLRRARGSLPRRAW